MRFFTRTVLVLVCVQLQGCLWLSAPNSRPDDFVQVNSWPELVGKSQADVLNLLGPPTYVVHDDNRIEFLYETVKADRAYPPLMILLPAISIFYEDGIYGGMKGSEVSCVLLDFEDNELKRYQTKTSNVADAMEMRVFWPRRYDCLSLFELTQEDLILGKQYYELNGNLDAIELYRKYLARAPDDNSGLVYLCGAADQGHTNAQIEVGRVFAQGDRGVQKDVKRAYVWYSLATSDGSDMHLQLLVQDMTSEQIKDAQRMLAEWQPGQCKRDLIPAASGG